MSAVVQVVKKSGRIENFQEPKLQLAIVSAAGNRLSLRRAGDLAAIAAARVHENTVTTEYLHDLVERVLAEHCPEVLPNYANYRRFKKQMSKSYDSARLESERILHSGDKENANRDSQLNSTKQTLTAEAFMRQLMRDFELPREIEEAHKDGWIYVHDLGARYLRQTNCCLFDMANLLKDGFYMNSVRYSEPRYITSAMAVASDVILQASAQQFGGFTVADVDSLFAPYAKKTFAHYKQSYEHDFGDYVPTDVLEKKAFADTVRDIEQGVQGLETKLNTVSSSLGQVPFVTISFGLDTSIWGREVSKAILKTREAGINGQTAIFPKLVFLSKAGVNREPGDANYDIYQAAIRCSQTRLYPDYLSLDGENNNLAEVYARCGQAVSPMGCRAFLSPYYAPDGAEVYVGRGNLGAVSLNLPKIAIESHGDINKFFDTIRALSRMIWRYHQSYAEKVGRQKASTNPLFYCEGGAWQRLDYDDEIASTIGAFTASLGYVGLHEALIALGYDGGVVAHHDLALQVVRFLKDMVDKDGNELLTACYPALYATPAESLCYTWAKHNREQYGMIRGVTDREYLTNSFHVPVWHEISAPTKISMESDFHAVSTGGRISYTEFPSGVPAEVLEEIVSYAMSKGCYFGVNIVSSACGACNYSSDFRDACPRCGDKDNVRTVSRVCGYLSIEVAGKHDQTGRYNHGKQAEVLERVKHV